NSPSALAKKICFVKMANPDDNYLLLHLNKALLGNQKLIVELCEYDDIPDDSRCLDILLQKDLELKVEWPSHIKTKLYKTDLKKYFMCRTTDIKLDDLELEPYPELKLKKGDEKLIEKIRKTVIVKDIDKNVSIEEILNFFDTECGEVFCGRKAEYSEENETKNLLIEFNSPISIYKALKLNGVEVAGSKIKY
ncbi:MAG: Protein srek1IP1, partial [Paramarteilia canceri]